MNGSAVSAKCTKEYPNLLIISSSVWSDQESSGNTFTNLFGDWDKRRIAMVYCKAAIPRNSVCDRYFQITETGLIRHMLDHRVVTGKRLVKDDVEKDLPHEFQGDANLETSLYEIFRWFRFETFLLLRELVWKFGTWRTKQLHDFLDEISPDVIFAPTYEAPYMNRIQQHIIKKTGVRAVGFIGDDLYTLRQFRFSPLFWIRRFWQRHSVRRTLRLCDMVYIMTPKQKEEYDEIFGFKSKILTKGGDFRQMDVEKTRVTKPIKMVYTGNVFYGRWKSLVAIGKTLDLLNAEGQEVELYVYTQNKLRKSVRRKLQSSDNVHLMGGIPPTEVKNVQQNADVVVFAESFNLRQRFETRLSFSTKLVDYFESARCIFAVGWRHSAPIDYLLRNDAAIVATSEDEIETKLRALVREPERILEYGKKAWDCGRRNHSIERIREMLRLDLTALSNNLEME